MSLSHPAIRKSGETRLAAPSAWRRRHTGAFTLIEMLVAFVILTMLLLLVTQMVTGIASVTSASGRRLSADDEVRTAFDRMAGDIAAMITRPEVSPLLVSKAGNDEFYFYSQAPASFSNAVNSQIAVIGYRVTTNGLERLGRGLGWDEVVFTNGPVSPNVTSTNIVAPSIFRMEYALLMKPGSTNRDGSTNGNGAYMQTNNSGQAMRDVAGIVVAVGILDQASRKIVPAGKLAETTLLGRFSDGSGSGIPTGAWITNARTLSIPAAAQAQTRVYQRYFPLNR